MKKIYDKVIQYLFLGFITVTPLISSAQGLVTCGGASDADKVCTLSHFFELITRVMKWGFNIGLIVSSLMFAYAGLLIMTSLGRPGQLSKAKTIFLNAFIGIVIMFVSYGVVWFILTKLGVNETFYQFLT